MSAMASDQDFNTSMFDDTIESMLHEAIFQPANGAEASTSGQLTTAVSLFANASAMDTSPDIPTPPPDTPPKEHGQHYYFSASPVTAGTEFIKGSSLEDSPPSSPSNSETSVKDEEEEDSSDGTSSGHLVHSDHENSESSDEDSSAEKSLPMNVKLPQRKGGMQLWQFLYTLLTDPDKKYCDLIEWTPNINSREFRLLEPEAIAIWWGEHKNKRNMSYDKLSRSLRYYYDKGIIKKVTGERYVYQFCINPEVMYKHIGNSDCRPKLKPMPVMARHATSKYQNQPDRYNLFPQDPLCVAQGPVSLAALRPPTCPPFSSNNIPFLHTHSFATPPPPPPPPPYPTYESSFMNGPDMDTPPPHFEFGHFDDGIKSSLPIRRCRSINSMASYELSMYEQLGQLFPPHSPYHSLSQTPPLMSPLTSENSSPLPPNYPLTNAESDEFDFNMLDELITSMESVSTHSPGMICTSPHSNIPVWNFS